MLDSRVIVGKVDSNRCPCSDCDNAHIEHHVTGVKVYGSCCGQRRRNDSDLNFSNCLRVNGLVVVIDQLRRESVRTQRHIHPGMKGGSRGKIGTGAGDGRESGVGRRVNIHVVMNMPLSGHINLSELVHQAKISDLDGDGYIGGSYTGAVLWRQDDQAGF